MDAYQSAATPQAELRPRRDGDRDRRGGRGGAVVEPPRLVLRSNSDDRDQPGCGHHRHPSAVGDDLGHGGSDLRSPTSRSGSVAR